ncbi:MAG: 6-phosphofructokinase [Xanthomonadales bacterium]|jgi:6-phosphofructokinase 1|nr:6-phosphofructokinase [Xanthomonadales bacterium]MDH3923613.1 6-phosphofructokinase [Xanthomonadales bacterium]MDH3939580.1 6-phosphofructokinase [Xanthomonadales bacterium]MDH3999738.1 6-phosphofructokinase [Xanthomonadales bacterium]
MKKNILYAQSGGVTPVINATACGVIETARNHRDQIGKVYAGKDGIIGVLKEELIDTSRERKASISALRHTPGGAFGSCRYKLKSIDESKREYERLIEVLRAHNIGYFLYNGGGDSSDTAHKVSQIGKKMGFPVQCIGVPKTIDNDLPITDNCPGFGSVAKYIAVSIMEASLDVESMASSSTKVFVLEVMGRHAGWIAAASGLVSREAGDPPHIILFPEVPFKQREFLKKVKTSVEQYGYCSIVVSEGVRDSKGKFLADAGTRDAFGHAQLGGVAPVVANLVREKLGYKYHWAVSDYLQRSARHLASRVDVDQAYAVGEAAVKFAIAGKSGVMPVIKRTSNNPYRWKIEEAQLSRMANREKMMPKSYIASDGMGITPAARRYLAPLIRGEDYPPYDRDGLPKYVKMRKVLAQKKLPDFKV